MSRSEDHERVFGVFAVSTAAHVIIFVALGFAPSPGEALRAGTLDFEILEPTLPETEEREPEPDAEPEPERPPEPEPSARPRNRAKAPEPTAREPEPVEPEVSSPETPIDFPGITLTSETGTSSWTTMVGSGEAIKGPVVVPPKPPRQAVRQSDETGDISKTPARRKRKLARPPQQPGNMDQTLLKHYPKQARDQGIEGLAVMRLRIMADGRVARVRVVRETFAGFGAACQKTLLSARWRPKLDDRGRPVAVDITYTCRFEVAY